jgi:SAM-dependent methyltransferase
VPPSSSVIDLGIGTGIVTLELAPQTTRILGVDSNPANVQHARDLCQGLTNVEIVLGDMIRVLEARGPFDVALLLHGLGYFADPVETLRSIGQGASRLVLEMPDFGSDPLNRLRLNEGLPAWSGDALYVTEYDAETLRGTLEPAGWQCVSLESRGGILYAVAERAP